MFEFELEDVSNFTETLAPMPLNSSDDDLAELALESSEKWQRAYQRVFSKTSTPNIFYEKAFFLNCFAHYRTLAWEDIFIPPMRVEYSRILGPKFIPGDQILASLVNIFTVIVQEDNPILLQAAISASHEAASDTLACAHYFLTKVNVPLLLVSENPGVLKILYAYLDSDAVISALNIAHKQFGKKAEKKIQQDLIRYKLNPSRHFSGMPLLIAAVRRKNEKLIEALLKTPEIDLNIANPVTGDTALMFAIKMWCANEPVRKKSFVNESKDSAIVLKLISAPNINFEQKDNKGKNTWELVTESGVLKALQEVLQEKPEALANAGMLQALQDVLGKIPVEFMEVPSPTVAPSQAPGIMERVINFFKPS